MIDYIEFDSSPREALMRIMNDGRVRRHLLAGGDFTPQSLERWIANKTAQVQHDPGCRVKGILVNGEYAGWCGIQKEEDGTYGLGVILSPDHWGSGPAVLEDMLQWSRELGHREVYIHLRATRPVSKGLMRRLASDCEAVEMQGRTFRRYRVQLYRP